ILFRRLSGQKQKIETGDQQIEAGEASDGGVQWIEKELSPAPVLAQAAKAMGAFPVPKLGRTAYEFWAFKASTGDSPTTVAIALQLSALTVYDEWLALLREAGARHLDELPRNADEFNNAAVVRKSMVALRFTFAEDPGLADRLSAVIERTQVTESERRL